MDTGVDRGRSDPQPADEGRHPSLRGEPPAAIHVAAELGKDDLALAQSANSAIIRWRCDGTIVFFNEYAQRFFGYSATEAVGRPVSVLVAARQSSGADQTGLVHDILDHPERYVSHVSENVCRDGRRVWMIWTNRAIVDDQGRVVEILAIGNDITQGKQAEEQLRRLAQFPNENPNPVLRIGADTRLLYANAAASALLAKLDWQPGAPLSEPLQALVRAARAADGPVEGEARAGDGRTWSFSAVQPPGEDYVNFYGRDVTARERAEESLARTVRHFELLADSAERLLRSTDPQKEVESLCTALMDHLGCQVFFNYLNESASGRLRLNACGGVPDDVRRRIEWLDYGDAVCGCVARDRARIVAEHIPGTCDPRTQLVAGLGVRAYACHPLLGPRGAVIGTLSFGSKTSDTFSEQDLGLMKAVANQVAVAMSRIAQERALRDSEERLRLAAVAGRLGTWDWHVDTNRVEWSEGHYTLLGYAPGSIEPSYARFEERIHSDDLARQQREVRESMTEHREYHCEYRVVWPDGSVHWLEARGRYIYDENDVAVRMFGVLMDIDENRRVQEQRLSLLEAERAARIESEKLVRLKDEFLATISHELRSPLNAITGWTTLLAAGKVEADKAVGIIKRSASSLTQIVEDLLDMSRITSGKVRLNVEAVSVSDIVSKAVETAQFSAQAKSIEIGVSFDPDLPPLYCDANRIQQVVWNLLNNAVKFTPDGGRVHLDISQSGDEVAIAVSDTGQGISPEFVPYLFEQFRQEDGSIARRHGGLGLGLSIVKRLVELHGGTVEGRSAGPGQGATFVVRLPRPKSSWPAGAVPLGPRHPESTGVVLDERTLAGVCVVAVDDDPFTLELLARILADAGAAVHTADSSRRGLELLEELRPDVLISDVGMAGEDGFGFIRKVRAAGDWRADLPALAVTALARPEDRDLVKAAGFDEHMGKPFDPGRLCMAVRDLVADRAA